MINWQFNHMGQVIDDARAQAYKLLDNYFILIDGLYIHIDKDTLWGLMIRRSIQDLCVDCRDDCRCLDHPWFNLKRKPKPINYLNPYR